MQNLVSKYQNLVQFDCQGDIIKQNSFQANARLKLQFDIDKIIIRDQDYKILCTVFYKQIKQILKLKQAIQIRTSLKSQNQNIYAINLQVNDQNRIYMEFLNQIYKKQTLVQQVGSDIAKLSDEQPICDINQTELQHLDANLTNKVTSNLYNQIQAVSTLDAFKRSWFLPQQNHVSDLQLQDIHINSQQSSAQKTSRLLYPLEESKCYGILRIGYDSQDNSHEIIQDILSEKAIPSYEASQKHDDECIENLRQKISKYQQQLLSNSNNQQSSILELTEYSA